MMKTTYLELKSFMLINGQLNRLTKYEVTIQGPII